MDDLISRQAAIDALLGITAMRNTIPLYSAIFNIKKLPSAQTEVRTQMSSADCISRQAVRLIESDSDAYPQEWNDDYEKGFTDALNKVIALPSAQPERGYIDQIQWERDIAVQQLADLGYGLGEKVKTDGDCISRQAAIDAADNMVEPQESEG